MARVVLENVSRVYARERRAEGGNGVTQPDAAAVRNVNLEVKDKEFLVLVGPSGCGKSTTLRMIAGLEDVSSGTIRIGDRVVNEVPPKDRDIAMVFQNYALYPHMSVYKNMAFGLELRHGGGRWRQVWRRLVSPRQAAEMAARRHQIAEQVHQAAAILGIESLLDRMPRQLSGGERQRVALGRAIVRQPAAFLFDEPLSNLDAKLRAEMRRELKQLHQRLQTTMIYVTHDQVEALTLGDRIVVMNRGEVQQVGSPREIYDRPANRFVAGFIGTPPMNFLEGTWQAERDDVDGPGLDGIRTITHRAWSFCRGTYRWTLPAGALDASADEKQPVVLGIRPEDVTIEPLADESPDSQAGEDKPLARIVAVEPLGDATVVSLEWEGQELLSKTGPRVSCQVGDRVHVNWDMRRAHWFAADSGERLAAHSHANR